MPRPKLDEDFKRQGVEISLSPEARKALDALARRHTGGNRSAMVERLVLEASRKEQDGNG